MRDREPEESDPIADVDEGMLREAEREVADDDDLAAIEREEHGIPVGGTFADLVRRFTAVKDRLARGGR